VASGDLTFKIDVSAVDETGQLLRALKHMKDSTAGVASNVRQSSDSIATGSAQTATGNADLSQRTEQQASNLQQTAASMDQIGRRECRTQPRRACVIKRIGSPESSAFSS
jgi:methyl-accepting chemotaxis protein